MAEAVRMPKSGISVESCIIGTWKKNVGHRIGIGDVLFDYETDKAAFECESTAEGVILEIFYHDGDGVEVLKPVCAVGAEGDDISAIRAEAGVSAEAAQSDGVAVAQGAGDATVASQDTAIDAPGAGDATAAAQDTAIGATGAGGATAAAQDTTIDAPGAGDATAAAQDTAIGAPGAGDATAAAQDTTIDAPDTGGATAATPREVADPTTGTPAQVSDNVSPRARNAADRLGLYVGDAVPTGPNGRVIERDVTTLAESVATQPETAEEADSAEIIPETTAQAPPASAPDSALALAGPFTDEKFSKIRSVIATSMHASLQNTAQLTHHHSFDATEVQAVRRAFKASENPAIKAISIGDMVLFAIVKTLHEHPDMNAHLADGNILRRFEDVNLGVAVDTPRGLMVPTIFAANKKTLSEISTEVKQLAAEARLGSINPDLLQGGSFTVSNLGPTGVEMFTPILNPPQVGIFGVCGVTTKVKQTEKGILTYPSIGMSLTYDHRAVDGAPASRFAQAVCEKLSQFSLLLDV